MTNIAAQDAAVAAKKAQDSELVSLKQQMDRLKGDIGPGNASKQKLRKACTDFEAVFISKIWEKMRATLPKDGLLHSPQEEMYRSMFDREFTEKMAADGGIGLGDMLYNQLKDKLSGGGKGTGKTGVRNLLSKLDGAPPVQPATTGALPEKPDFALPGRRNGGALQSSATTAAPGVSVAGPQPPASVPGAVMADVEALARRIEADFDRRQAEAVSQGAAQSQAARYGQSAGSGERATGSRIAVTG
ncbi:MAG: rod-binding protein [Desulfovibrio sp.]|jgi:flagellar protein FlgJ